MARKDKWTSVSITKEQLELLDEIHRDTRLNKHDIIDLALMEKYPEYFREEIEA